MPRWRATARFAKVAKKGGAKDGTYVDELLSYTVGATRYFTHANHLYSIAATTNAGGSVVERYTYDAYGTQTVTNAAGTVTLAESAVGQTRGFTGYILDGETGLYHARARQYDSRLGRFVGRDPIRYVDGMSLYRAYFVANSVDPFGLRDKLTFDKLLKDLLDRNPKLTDKQKKWIERQLSRGCVGATCALMGTSEDYSDCFSTKAAAEARAKEMKSSECCPHVYSVHLWNDTGIDPERPDVEVDDKGKVFVDNWDQSGRPPGTWKEGGGGGVNFDFGYLSPDGTMLHADMYHNPDKDGDGKGDYWPEHPIREATFYRSTLEEWTESYADFNFEMWCAQCGGDYR